MNVGGLLPGLIAGKVTLIMLLLTFINHLSSMLAILPSEWSFFRWEHHDGSIEKGLIVFPTTT
jgi:hypothetical protein